MNITINIEYLLQQQDRVDEKNIRFQIKKKNEQQNLTRAQSTITSTMFKFKIMMRKKKKCGFESKVKNFLLFFCCQLSTIQKIAAYATQS